jgi:hypothetical protein
MNRRESLPHSANRRATALILLAVLGTAGCMTRRPAPPSTAGDIVSWIEPMGDPAEQATDDCEQFGCEP